MAHASFPPEKSRLVVVRLDRGQDLAAGLLEALEAEGCTSAMLTGGIGALEATTLGYFNGQGYDPHVYPALHELLSLSGSAALDQGRPHLHLHATLGTPSGAAVGGHVLSARVAVVVEALAVGFPEGSLQREARGPVKALSFPSRT